MKQQIFLITVLVVALALTASGGLAQDEPVRVAIVMPSSITDLAWSQAIYNALVKVQEEMGGESAMEIAYTEGMFDVTAAAQALRDYAEDGYDIVIAHGTQYGTSLFELAPDYPDTSFAWGTASDTGSEQGLTNIFAYEAAAEQGGYVNGVMAGLLTESGVIGVVGPVAAGDALLYVNGFIQGVEASNPDATVNVTWTDSFSDVAKGTEAAQTHIAAGADVLTGSSQMVVGAIEAIQGVGGYWFGTQSDQSAQWPTAVVASQVFDWTDAIRDMIQQRQNGVTGGVAYNLTLENGGLKFAFGDVEISPEVLIAVGNAIEGIISGDIEVARELPES